jgi:P pilus assembly chaperone PapD
MKNKLKKIVMKKILFLFALLASITASAAVTVTPLSVVYNTKTVKFRVSWTGTPYNNRVWVWIDLCPVTGTSPGTFAQAIIGNPSATAGSITTVAGNTRGFYVTTNPSTVTATLSNATGQFNWCAYGSDYPPNVLANTNGSYTLAGTPPFTLIASNGTTMQR